MTANYFESAMQLVLSVIYGDDDTRATAILDEALVSDQAVATLIRSARLRELCEL
jgi:hypothetical protein